MRTLTIDTILKEANVFTVMPNELLQHHIIHRTKDNKWKKEIMNDDGTYSVYEINTEELKEFLNNLVHVDGGTQYYYGYSCVIVYKNHLYNIVR